MVIEPSNCMKRSLIKLKKERKEQTEGFWSSKFEVNLYTDLELLVLKLKPDITGSPFTAGQATICHRRRRVQKYPMSQKIEV